jgi:hypothetical protein
VSTQSTDLELDVYPLRELPQEQKGKDGRADGFGRGMVDDIFDHDCPSTNPAHRFNWRLTEKSEGLRKTSVLGSEAE